MKYVIKHITLGLALLLWTPGTLVAQRAPPVESGTRVRLASPRYTGEATVVRSGPDTLTVAAGVRGRPVAVPLATVTNLERRRSATAGERVLRGAKWGALAGAGVGTLGILMSERGPGDPPRALWPLVGVGYFGAIGAGVGLLTRQYRWEDVPVPGEARVSWRRGELRVSVLVNL